MSIRPTALISIATLGGSAIGLPIYLVQKQSTRTDLVQQAFPAVIPATSTTEFGDSDS
ncbi:hypothetical protein [Mycoplasma ovis]|uniref:hypothetical protein n=1 Tax=Mycoplasma ovis TaxID=171632 RepID=UPI00130E3EA9|nr:hypothetical protein [Mycoplasma ovis]